ncbi:MAG: hypothetical protein K2P78_14070 [Gemmataceae bacterium]|nr:hypothetical protein [Gemmataceae bacterium]
MLYFQGWAAHFDSPLTVEVAFSDTQTGDTDTLSLTVEPPSATTTMFASQWRTDIYQVIQTKGWKQTKTRIDGVTLIHPDATGHADEIAFCRIIENFLKQTYTAP